MKRKIAEEPIQNPKSKIQNWLLILIIAVVALGVFGTGMSFLEQSAKDEMVARKAPGYQPSLIGQVNPFPPDPTPMPTPQLSKEYVYAGVGGQNTNFPRMKLFSGAWGDTLLEAGKGIRHNQLWWTTAGEIRQWAGRVFFDPEPAYSSGTDRSGNRYPDGPMNFRHATIRLGLVNTFQGPRSNPAPKSERPPAPPK